jgi:phosphatidylserine/phosphatidylglycerophosphate/cardiolipin synthase-like enzyme
LEEKTGVYVLEDGAGSMVARAWLTEYAEKTIDIQYFIFCTDNIGLIAIDYLVRAADRGIKIRILVDDIMVDAELSDILMVDHHENIEIRIYNPGVNLGKSIFGKLKTLTTDFRGFNQRMHNKTFIVDGHIVITGGRNIADEYFDFDHEYNFRDRDVLLMGRDTDQVNTSFEEFWNSSLSIPVLQLVNDEEFETPDSVLYETLHQYACNPVNFWPQIRDRISRLPEAFRELQSSNRIVWLDSIRFVSDDPGKNEETKGLGGGGKTTTELINLIKSAKETIEIQSPYLVTTELSRGLFRDATERGVKVRILTNSMASTDNMEAFSGYQRDREELLGMGVRIFEYKPDAKIRYEVMTGALQEKLNFTPIFGLHAKSMVIDGKTTVIGTFNLDPRSANLNTECITIIESEEIARGVLQGMELEFGKDNAWETTMDFNPDQFAPKGKRIKSWTRKAVPKGIL